MATLTQSNSHGRANAKRATSTSPNPRTYPAPERERTPTDLTPDQVKEITEVVNPLIADAFALYVKTKNFHWHLSGRHFRDYHLLFDEHAEQIFDSIDMLAERLRRLGGTTIRSISHISALQTIDDDNREFVSADDMILRLLADNKHMARQQRAAIDVCADNHDEATSNALQEIIDGTERRVWFLYEISQGIARGE